MGCAMAKLSRLEVHLDNGLYIFQPGEMLSGHLLLEVQEDVLVHGGRVWFFGNAETSWQETDKLGNVDNIGGDEIFFQNCLNLFGKELTDNSRDTEFILRAGLHNFPFEFLLPDELPSSFELCLNARARIRYSVRAEIEDSQRTTCHSLEKSFLVLAVFDLNDHPCLRDRVSLKKEFALANCCVSKGSVCCVLGLNKTAFVPGETLKLDMHVLNQSSVLVRSTCITFEQRMILLGTGNVRKQATALIFSITGQRIKAGGSGFYQDVIHIPPLPPSGFAGCNIIHVEYYIQVIIEACSLLNQAENLEMSLPILIGSVPMRDTFGDSIEVIPCYAFFDYATGDIIEYEPSTAVIDCGDNKNVGCVDYLRPAYRYFKTASHTKRAFPFSLSKERCHNTAQNTYPTCNARCGKIVDNGSSTTKTLSNVTNGMNSAANQKTCLSNIHGLSCSVRKNLKSSAIAESSKRCFQATV